MQVQQYTQTPSEDAKKVHIKVQFGNDMRRFSLQAGSYNYTSLVQYVKRLFEFPQETEIQLKYKDDEGDMIIISSDEELKFAIELFSASTDILRLTVFEKPSNKTTHLPGDQHRGFRGGRGGNWGGLNGKIEKLTRKRDELSEKLKDLGPNAPPKLENKIACLDKRIGKMKEWMEFRQEKEFHHPPPFQPFNPYSVPFQPEHGPFVPPIPSYHPGHVYPHVPPQPNDQSFPQQPPQQLPWGGMDGDCGRKWGGRGHGCGRGYGRGGHGGRGRMGDPTCMQMWSLRKEKKHLKKSLSACQESDRNAKLERIAAIKNELKELREKRRSEFSPQ